MIDYSNQLKPVASSRDELYLIKDIDDLIDQMISLRDEALLQIKSRISDPIFYKDYNACNIVIMLLNKIGYERSKGVWL